MTQKTPFHKYLVLYGLLLLNMVLGFLMFTTLRQFFLIFNAWMLHDGRLTDGSMVRARFLHSTLDGVLVILVGMLALIALPLLEQGYHKALKQSFLLRRGSYVLAVQLIFIAGLQLLSWLVFGARQGSSIADLISVAQLLFGLSLFWWVQQQLHSKAEHSTA